jgi:hypothetical protein
MAPGIHGAVVIGVHGIGVSTPSAADVAAATCGLASELHMPNEGTLTIGLLSWMDAAGLPSIVTLAVGSTFSVAGATPKLHIIIAVPTTF